MTALDRLRAVPTADLLRLAECELRGRRWTCPACRHDDSRGTVALAGQLWRCHHCGAGGDGPSIAALLATGHLRPAAWGPVYRWAEERGVIARDDGQRHVQPPPVVEVRGRLRPLPEPPAALRDAELRERWQAAQLAAGAVAGLRDAGVDATGAEEALWDAALEYIRARRRDAVQAVCDAAVLARCGRLTDDVRLVEAAWVALLGALPTTATLTARRADVPHRLR